MANAEPSSAPVNLLLNPLPLGLQMSSRVLLIDRGFLRDEGKAILRAGFTHYADVMPDVLQTRRSSGRLKVLTVVLRSATHDT